MITAPLYYYFAQFVKQKAQYPIFVSYRSGYPIEHALDHIGVESKPLWINIDVSEKLELPIVWDYCQQQGLDAPFTFVDNGYKGTIPSKLTQSSLRPTFQTLLLQKGMYMEHSDVLSLLYSEKHGYATATYAENAPKKYKAYNEDIFHRTENGTVTVSPQEKSAFDQQIFQTFFDGMTDGYALCKNKEFFPQYYEVIKNAALVSIDSDFFPGLKDEKLSVFKQTEKLSRCFDQVQKVFA